MTDQQQADATPLELARVWAGRVYQIAAHYEQREREDPGFGGIEAHVHGAGRQQHEAAEMAAFMAVVSLAEDVHRIADLLGAAAPPGGPSPEGKDQGS